MKKMLLVLVGVLFMITVANATEKKALMLAVFGTSTEASVTFDTIAPLLQKEYTDRTLVVPYTSPVIRKKLNKEISDSAKKILSPDEMFEKLKKEGYTDIYVATTIVFNGVEYEKLQQVVDKFAKENKNIKVKLARAILGDEKNVAKVVDTLAPYIRKNAINIVVAHGSHDGHPVVKTYLAVEKAAKAKYAKTFMGTVEGEPSIEATMKQVAQMPEKNVRFIVFMFVAGDHAENDIAGAEDNSMFSAIKAMGKTPDIMYVKVGNANRIVSLGLDKNYQKLLIAHIKSELGR